jgi:hypothetical protein
MTLRTRIEARMAALREEREVAEAVDRREWALAMADLSGPYTSDAYDHTDAQDPAHTIARIDRELAGCEADLALLNWHGWHDPMSGWPIVRDAMLAHYPKEDG